MRSAGRLYRLHLGLTGAGVATVAFAAAGAAGAFTLDSGSIERFLEACRALLPSLGPAGYLALALTLVTLAPLALGLHSLLRQALATRRHLRSVALTGEVVTIDGTRCCLTSVSEPQAFCAGFLRPRVYVSEGARRLLAPQELAAVVAHERHHRDRRDPLRLLVLRALAEAFFFLPILKAVSRRYASLVELAADEAAVAAADDRRPLARALLRFETWERSPAAVVAIAPERVDHLAGDPAATHWRLPVSFAAASLVLMGALVTLAIVSMTLSDGGPVDLAVAVAEICMLLMIGAAIAALAAGGTLVARFSPADATSRRGRM